MAIRRYKTDIRDVASSYLTCQDPQEKTILEEEFMRLSYPIVKTAVGRKVSLDDFEDVVEDCIESVVRGLKTGKLRRHDEATGWVYRIAVNRTINYYRQNSTRPRTFPIEAALNTNGNGEDPETEAELQSRYDALRRAVHDLPAAYQEAIELVYYRGLSTREAAKITGKTESSIKITTCRARKSIRDILAV